MTKTPIIGFIRYSCRASFTQKNFFNSEYLDYRLKIFTNVTLKSFQEQTNKNFSVFLLHSENLPEKYKLIFSQLENDNLFLHNIYIPDTELEGSSYINALYDSINHVEFVNNLSINFRIDNDDAVPENFIENLNYYLKPEYYNNVISFANISIIQRIHKYNYLIQEKYFPSNSMGLAYVTGIDDYKTIMTLGDHGKINQKYTMILPCATGGIQTINGKNIMNSLYFGNVNSYNAESIKNYLEKRNFPCFDFTCLGICKRHIVLEILKKTFNYLKKNKKLKNNVGT